MLEEKIALLLKNKRFNSENERIKTIIYKTFDQNGKVIKEGKNEYSFNKNEHSLTIKEISNEIVFRKISYKYDERQNIIEVCHYSIDNVYTYEQGSKNIIDVAPSKNETLIKKEIYSYDTKKNIIKCETQKNDGINRLFFLSTTEYKIEFES